MSPKYVTTAIGGKQHCAVEGDATPAEKSDAEVGEVAKPDCASVATDEDKVAPGIFAAENVAALGNAAKNGKSKKTCAHKTKLKKGHCRIQGYRQFHIKAETMKTEVRPCNRPRYTEAQPETVYKKGTGLIKNGCDSELKCSGFKRVDGQPASVGNTSARQCGMKTYFGTNAGKGKDDMSPVSADGAAKPECKDKDCKQALAHEETVQQL